MENIDILIFSDNMDFDKVLFEIEEDSDVKRKNFKIGEIAC